MNGDATTSVTSKLFTTPTPTSATEHKILPTQWAAGFPSKGETYDYIPHTVEDLFSWYRPLLISFAHKYQHVLPVGETIEDILQEASIGLWAAYRNYNPTRGNFAAFTRACVHSAVMDYLRRIDPVSTSVRRMEKNLPEWFLHAVSNRQVTGEEIHSAAHYAGITPHQVKAIINTTRLRVLSTEAITATNPYLLEKKVAISDDFTDITTTRIRAKTIMDRWNSRDKTVFESVVLYRTKQSIVADYHGLTQARINQIVRQCWILLLSE
jgi:RNA polymerase sigma factor (sigma-70 family)